MELALECCPRDTMHWVRGDPLRLELTHVLLSFQSVSFSQAFRDRAAQQSSFEAMGPDGQAEFIRNTLGHRTSLYTRPVIGRLYAMFHIAEIDSTFIEKTGETISSWMNSIFGITPDEYLTAAFLSGVARTRLNLNQPDADQLAYSEDTIWDFLREPLRGKLRCLYAFASHPVGDPSGIPAYTIDEYLYRATAFHAHPIINFGHFSLCVSPNLVLRKFLYGLPYLVQQATQRARGRNLTENEIKACRSPFGILFESYVGWLVRELLSQVQNVEIIANVGYGPNAERRECDLVIRRNDVALVLEIKSTLPTIRFRQTGRFEDLDPMLEPGAKQVFHAARAIRAGTACRPDGSLIEAARWVIPCVVTYDDLPLYEPISVFYERHLVAKTRLPLFTEQDGIEPIQFFDVDFIESWETDLDLSPASAALFGYLIQRARRDNLRYRPVLPNVANAATQGALKPFNDIVERSRIHLDSLVRSWKMHPSEPPRDVP